MNKKLLIGIGVLAVAGVGGFLWYRSSKKRQEAAEDAAIDAELRDLDMGTGAGDDFAPSVPTKSPQQYLREQMGACKNNDHAMQAIRARLFIPEEEAWSRFGYDPTTEKCQLLGWMLEITNSKRQGKQWNDTDTPEGLAQAAAFQLAKQKGRV